MKLRAAFLAAFLAASLATGLLLTAPAAQAQTWRHTDASRDVIVAPYDDSNPPDLDETPRRGDLTKVSARYDGEALQVATSVTNYCGNNWELRVTTSRGDSLVFARGISSGDGCFQSYVRARRNGNRLSCADLTVQRTSAGIVARIPRTCLGSPYRLRIGLQLTTEDDSEAGAQTYDDVLRTGRYTENQPKLSPWIVGS